MDKSRLLDAVVQGKKKRKHSGIILGFYILSA
jgi:hypothetical protein